MNTHVGYITRWQARLGGFVESPSPSLKASIGDNDDDHDDEDGDASSLSDDEMST